MATVCLSLTRSDRDFEISKGLDILFSVFKDVNLYYVDEPDPEKLTNAAVNYMLGSLDPYTTYIPEKNKEEYEFHITGEYGGVGAIIQLAADTNLVQAKEIYEGSPSHKAGIRPGDRFLSVAGEDVRGFTVSGVRNLLRGKAGATIDVEVLRPGVAKPLKLKVTREVIKIPSVEYYGMLDSEIGYIMLRGFEQSCAEEVRKAFLDLRDKHGAKKMILDLRGNPGGLLDQSLKIVNNFVPQGSRILETRGRRKAMDRLYTATEAPLDTLMPMAVLISRSSASASEIVSGAMQDLDRAVVLGQRSFGKGLVQMTREVAHGGYMKVTSAKYYTPSGRCIQAVDYSHRDESGAVGYVPDSLISEFSTKAGRKVYDGGGIAPDVLLPVSNYAPAPYALFYGDYPFRYIVSKQFNVKLDQNGHLSDADFADFVSYVKAQKDFEYRTYSQDSFDRMVRSAKLEGIYDQQKELFEKMEVAVKPDIDRDIKASDTDIRSMIEFEVICAKSLRKEALRHKLQYDADVDSAVAVLRDEARYRGLLNGTVKSHAGDKRTNAQ